MTPAVQLSWLVCNQRNCPLQYLGDGGSQA
ncbi:hypothetical protein CY35_01G191900 [Sphagnum magellanicum]|nr:hypothetical protein CY35_01G191900 [Sphagnum magellanicum]